MSILPTYWAICDSCRGEGRSSAYLGAFTPEQLAEEGPEFIEDYMSGFYDQDCDHCRGTGKVRIVDRDAAELMALRIPHIRTLLDEHDAAVEHDHECRMEARNIARMMGDWT